MYISTVVLDPHLPRRNRFQCRFEAEEWLVCRQEQLVEVLLCSSSAYNWPHVLNYSAEATYVGSVSGCTIVGSDNFYGGASTLGFVACVYVLLCMYLFV